MSDNTGFGKQVIRGGVWILALELSNQVLQFVKTFYAATILSPADFGIVGFAFLVISFLDVLSTTGMKEAIIQRKDDLQHYISSVWIFETVKGAIVLTACLLLAAPLAEWFAPKNTELTTIVIRLIGVIFFLQSAVNVGVLYLEKNIEFGRYFFYQISGTVVDVVLTVVCVSLLKNVWALFIGVIAGSFVKLLVSFIAVKYRPNFSFTLSHIRELFHYGKWVLRSRIFTFFGLQLDSVVVSGFLGLHALGIYQMAFRIGNLPITQLSNVMGRIVFPSFAKVQDDLPAVKGYFLASSNLLMVAIAPLIILVFCLIPEFTHVFLNEEWLPIIPVVRVLIISGFIRIFATIIDYLFYSLGQPKLSAQLQFWRLIVFAICIAPLTYYGGAVGVAFSGMISIAAVTIYYLWKVTQMLDINREELLNNFGYPALFAALITAIVLLLKPFGDQSIVSLFVFGIIAMLAYGCIGILLTRFTSFKIFAKPASLIRNLRTSL